MVELEKMKKIIIIIIKIIAMLSIALDDGSVKHTAGN